jgi:type IV pilus assembly protein PilA
VNRPTQKLFSRLNGDREAGFTLIELLIVMLILANLAAIAMPAFFSQKAKARDSKAKETAHVAQVAIQTCATENLGSYVNCDTLAKLAAVEPTLTGAPVTIPVHTATAFTIAVSATGGNTFSIENNAGAMSYPCTVATSNRGGCPGSGLTAGVWG